MYRFTQTVWIDDRSSLDYTRQDASHDKSRLVCAEMAEHAHHWDKTETTAANCWRPAEESNSSPGSRKTSRDTLDTGFQMTVLAK